VPAGRPPKYKTPEEMQTVIDEYFAKDAFVEIGGEKYFRPAISGIALALGMSRQALLDYEKKGEFLDTIRTAKLRVEHALEQNLHGGAVTGSIFNLKTNFGWKDNPDKTIRIDLPENSSATDKAEVILQAISTGKLDLKSGVDLLASIKSLIDIEESTEIKQRIEAMEKALNG
jgi:hypothetical protein